MTYTFNIFKKAKNQPDIWFFYGFLLTFTLSVRKVLFYFPIQGTFNEYTGIYIYLSDMFLLLTIGSWLYILLCNNTFDLSRYRLWITILRHKLSTLSTSNLIIIFPLLFLLWSFISIAWSDNQMVAIFRSLKLLEYYLLFIYIALRIVPRGTSFANNIFRNCSTWNITFLIIISVAVIQSVIGIFQVTFQHSLGLHWLKESIISPNIDGVAKIMLNGDRYLRAYGLFPHPNILGGFLLFSIIFTILYRKLFHVEQFSTPFSLIRSGAEGDVTSAKIVPRLPRGMFHVEHSIRGGTFLIKLALAVQLIALFLSFSKSAILGLLLTLFYMYVVPHLTFRMLQQAKSHNVPHGTFQIQILKRMFHVEQFRLLLLGFLILISLLVILKPNFNSILFQSLSEREAYINVSRGTISANPIIGVGIGQFVPTMAQYANGELLLWQYQPVHNVFLLIWSELGLIGLFIFIYWLWKMFHVEHSYSPLSLLRRPASPAGGGAGGEVKPGGGSNTDDTILDNTYSYLSNVITLQHLRGILLGFFFIMLFDHYFWDIQQGSFIFWLVFGLIAGYMREINRNYSRPISCYCNNKKPGMQNLHTGRNY